MINLQNEAKRYRVFVEEGGVKTDPWCWELRTKEAILYPKTANSFAILWGGKGSKALKSLCQSEKRLDGEVLYIFHNNALQDCLSAVRFAKKRQVTEAMRQAGKKLAASYGFKPNVVR